MKKQITLFIIIIVVIAVVSGCGKKPQNNQIVNNTTKPINNENQTQDNQGVATTTVSGIASSTEEIDTSDWKIYKDNRLGFEFKYPESWEYTVRENGYVELKDIKTKVYYEGSETYLIGISVINFNNLDDLNEYVENWKNSKLRNGWIKNVRINNIDTIQGNDFFGLNTIVISLEKNIVVKITKGQFSPVYEPLDDLYISLISSWKFNSK